jgi:iron complex transport system ATP-binding protein
MNVKAEGIAISLGRQQILKGIGVEARSGEFVGVIGPNGSGKSTLLKCVYRVLKPERGAILLDGRPTSGMSIRESAKKLAVVSQHNHLSFEFTVRDFVLMGRSPISRDGARYAGGLRHRKRRP